MPTISLPTVHKDRILSYIRQNYPRTGFTAHGPNDQRFVLESSKTVCDIAAALVEGIGPKTDFEELSANKNKLIDAARLLGYTIGKTQENRAATIYAQARAYLHGFTKPQWTVEFVGYEPIEIDDDSDESVKAALESLKAAPRSLAHMIPVSEKTGFPCFTLYCDGAEVGGN